MQTSSSGWTPVLFIVIDLLGVAYSLARMQRRVRKLQQLVPAGGQLLDCAMFLLRDPKTRQACALGDLSVAPNAVVRQTGGPGNLVVIVPINTQPTSNRFQQRLDLTGTSSAVSERIPPLLKSQLDMLGLPERKMFVQQTIELLHSSETFILAEYVEVIVPIVYSVYATVMSQLPNSAFYPQLRDLTPAAYRRTVGTVLLYAVLELATILPLDWILRRRLGFRPMQQLMLALQTESGLMAAELTLLLVYMVQVSLDHFGTSPRRQWTPVKAPMN